MLISVWIVWSFWLLASETPGSPITLGYTPSVTLDGCDHCSTLILRDAPTETAGGNHVANFVANSLLAAFLVEQFAWGHFSPQLIQKIAALACSDFDRAREQEELSLDGLCTCPSPLQSTCLSKRPWEIGCNRSCYLTKCLRHCITTTLRHGKNT